MKDVIEINQKMLSECSYEEMKKNLIEVCARRARPGEKPIGDFEVLQPEFIDFREDGTLVVKYPIFDWQCNGLGTLQGGMQSYIMDCTYGMLGYTSIGCKPIASVDMTSNYLKSASVAHDKEVFVYARIMNMGRRLLHGECKMYNSKGLLIATSSTNMIRL